MRRTLFILIIGLFVWPRGAAAQSTPRFGIVMGYPAQVGVLWTLADRIAIRPELNWTHSSTETTTVQTIFNVTGLTTNAVTTTTETNTIGPGVSALIYVSTHEGLRIYVVPRFAYSRATSSTNLTVSLPPGVPAPSGTTKTSNYNISGSLGAQYSVAKHFGLFGEVGLAFGRTTLSPPSSLISTDATNRTIGLRSGAGVILFLGS
ncbi:MAG TPA: hypothetical protein VKE51_40835 [Vicinamibacterales bacterium]|nr:hypothetical protein [Vicinamibacterales bacterium]